ncbi:MAG: hypothetical protein OXE76_03730 [Alphaproteobacteria bacterium]|nr:hypothetical protein [Alphaproteobacteria bacterium]
MSEDSEFLAEFMPRPWTPEAKHGLQPVGLFLGNGQHAAEVAVARSIAVPSRMALLDSWKARRSGRAAPVLLVVLHPGGAALCGASGEEPPTSLQLDAGQVERLCREILDQPDRHAALRFLAQALPSLETALPGLNNEGLLALHELEHGAPGRADWPEAEQKAQSAVGKRARSLISALGFGIERLDNLTDLLRSRNGRAALAVMLHESESPEAGTARFNNLSPVSYALTKADAENLAWVILVQGNRLRLYSTAVEAGVGRRGRTETYVECQPSLLSDEHLAYLWLLFSAEALAPQGSLSEILDGSRRFAGDLAERLRERIYGEVVPVLAQGIAVARKLDRPGPKELERTFEMALTVLFRVLFIAYAEDRDLLPYRFNEAYRRRSLKQKAQELAECVIRGVEIAQGSSHWAEVSLLWQAVAAGNREWGVPAYNGGLFSEDPHVSHAGATLAELDLPNEIFEAALRALLVIETSEGVPGPVDFRSLGVREFGTIYEGLLESELALAATDLSLDRKGNYVPVRPGREVAVEKGAIYLHNRSGVRKSSGTYYTKPFAVEHLLDGALEPALADHFARLGTMDDTGAAQAFFDFRIADIAMGSGHFLIAAIDRIEKGMADFLARRDLPSVRRELAGLRGIALRELGELGEVASIEDGQLLRRMIARRCIYGVDLNALSVQLARLAVWIHTFVPGLPLSVLDHTLAHGNALVGIGTIEEIRKKFEQASDTLFAVDAESLLGQAAKPLNRLANLNDATLQDIATARQAMQEARQAIGQTEALCDLITAAPISLDEKVAGFPFERWDELKDDLETHETVQAARRELDDLHVLHFPIAFPEVFLRMRPGFDVIVGNPPWQEATLEEHAFWARHFPGLRGLPSQEREAEQARLRERRPDLVASYQAERAETDRVRKVLVSGGYPGMGTGDPDLYKAFCWRFWNLSAAEGGRIGVVLPRSALAVKGSAAFRQTMFREAASVDIAMLLNNRKWVFGEVHPQYTIGLVCVARGTPEEKPIRLRGPFPSQASFDDGAARPATEFDREDVLAWNDTASLPLLPDPDSVEVFAQIRKAPRLDLNITGTEGGGGAMASPPRPGDGRHTAEGTHGLRPARAQWRARPDAELHATQQKYLMTFAGKNRADGYWPVYKGESFDIWNPDTGIYYAWADPEPAIEWVLGKRLRAGNRRGDSPHREFTADYRRDRNTLPCFAPRVAFRDVARATDSRTVIACLLPPKVFITNKGPYFLWPRGDKQDQTFLLGVLCSIPLDWYARRFVELNVNFFIINPFPIPRPTRDDPRWQRVVALAGRLACPDDRFADWAAAVGVECGPLAAEEKQDMIHELDAVVAHLYGLSEPQLVHVFKTFHEGWDFEERLNCVLRHYRSWAGRL